MLCRLSYASLTAQFSCPVPGTKRHRSGAGSRLVGDRRPDVKLTVGQRSAPQAPTGAAADLLADPADTSAPSGAEGEWQSPRPPAPGPILKKPRNAGPTCSAPA